MEFAMSRCPIHTIAGTASFVEGPDLVSEFPQAKFLSSPRLSAQQNSASSSTQPRFLSRALSSMVCAETTNAESVRIPETKRVKWKEGIAEIIESERTAKFPSSEYPAKIRSHMADYNFSQKEKRTGC